MKETVVIILIIAGVVFLIIWPFFIYGLQFSDRLILPIVVGVVCIVAGCVLGFSKSSTDAGRQTPVTPTLSVSSVR